MVVAVCVRMTHPMPEVPALQVVCQELDATGGDNPFRCASYGCVKKLTGVKKLTVGQSRAGPPIPLKG